MRTAQAAPGVVYRSVILQTLSLQRLPYALTHNYGEGAQRTTLHVVNLAFAASSVTKKACPASEGIGHVLTAQSATVSLVAGRCVLA